MIHHPRLLRLAAVIGFTVALLPVAVAGPFRTAQLPSKEPPLFGQQPQVPPPPPPPPKFGQQPVPVVPGPMQPPPGQIMQPPPGQIMQPPPGPLVQPLIQPMPGCIGVPCPPVDPPSPLIKIQVRVAECSMAGQELEYHIRVENCSPATAHHVLVRNPLPCNCRFVRANPEPSGKEPELVWSMGTLCAGECREICLVLAPLDTADVKNCARVQFEHGQCVITRIANAPPGMVEPPKVVMPPKIVEPPKVIDPPKVEDPPKVVPTVGKLSMKITGPKQQYANLPAKYQITVVNNGDKPAENLLVTAFLPEKNEFVSASDNGRFVPDLVNPAADQVLWLLGNLPAGASRTLQVTYKVTAAGEYCLKASALADVDNRAHTDACTKFEGVSTLFLDAKDTKDPVGVGGETSYRIAITNTGTASLTNVKLDVVVPREFMLVRAKGETSPPKQENLPPPTAEGQVLNFAPLKELKPGETQVYEVFATAMKSGDARWRTVLTADQLTGGPVEETESTTVFSENDPIRPMQPGGVVRRSGK